MASNHEKNKSNLNNFLKSPFSTKNGPEMAFLTWLSVGIGKQGIPNRLAQPLFRVSISFSSYFFHVNQLIRIMTLECGRVKCVEEVNTAIGKPDLINRLAQPLFRVSISFFELQGVFLKMADLGTKEAVPDVIMELPEDELLAMLLGVFRNQFM